MTRIQVDDAAGMTSAVCLAAGAPSVLVAMCVANSHFVKHWENLRGEIDCQGFVTLDHGHMHIV